MNWQSLSEDKYEEIILSYTDLQEYLKQLDTLHRKRILEFVENHPRIQIRGKGIEKYFYSRDNSLRELAYLVNSSHELKPEKSSLSLYEQKVDSKLANERVGDLTITRQNFQQFLKRVSFLKLVDECPFEITIKQEGEFSQNSLIIASKCREIKKIYILFEDFHELIKLQALLDINWKLTTIVKVRQHLQTTKGRFLKINHEGHELFFFQLSVEKDWKVFLYNINKQLAFFCFVAITHDLFPKLLAYRSKINIVFKVGISDPNFILNGFTAIQAKVFKPQIEFSIIQNLAIKVAEYNSKVNEMKKKPLSWINSYIGIILKEKGFKEVAVTIPDEQNTIYYIYFTYYQLALRIEQQYSQIKLVKCNYKEEITNKVYLNSLQTMINEAVLIGIPFFSFCQMAHQIVRLPTCQLCRLAVEDANRWFYYQYELNRKYYKMTYQSDVNVNILTFQPTKLIRFSTPSILNQMGSLKSVDIIKKYKDGQEGCMLAKVNLCKVFLQKCSDLVKIKQDS